MQATFWCEPAAFKRTPKPYLGSVKNIISAHVVRVAALDYRGQLAFPVDATKPNHGVAAVIVALIYWNGSGATVATDSNRYWIDPDCQTKLSAVDRIIISQAIDKWGQTHGEFNREEYLTALIAQSLLHDIDYDLQKDLSR